MEIDDDQIDRKSFAWNDLVGMSRWTDWTPVFGSLTVVGATSYFGRYRVIGRALEFEVKFSAATSIASTAGTDYLNLPIPAVGYSGISVMTNSSTNIAVGVCHISVSSSRCYLPTQGASASVFNLCGSYEI